jgi:large subunit ribosomal protein L9
MELILCQDVASLGKCGQLVKVKPGHARNFLLPQKLACVATPANLKRIEQQKAKQQAQYEATKKEAEALAEKLSKVSCTVVVEVNDLDKLYGSVSETEIAKALEVEGHKIDRKLIVLDNPIDALGIFDVNINLHPEVTAKIRLWVAKK